MRRTLLAVAVTWGMGAAVSDVAMWSSANTRPNPLELFNPAVDTSYITVERFCGESVKLQNR